MEYTFQEISETLLNIESLVIYFRLYGENILLVKPLLLGTGTIVKYFADFSVFTIGLPTV